MAEDQRIQNEILHGEYIREHGEEIWNWSSPAGKLRWARRCLLFKEFIGNRKSLVLEIGCGTGLFTKELAETDNQIVAIDISEALIEKAKERVHTRNVEFVVDNAYKTKFKPKSYDFIVGSSSLHHLDVDLALQEFSRILKPGGGIMFTEPNMMNPQIALIKNIPAIKRRAGDSPDETAFFRWGIAGKLRDHGFTEISIVPFDFMYPGIPESLLGVAGQLTSIIEKMPFLKEIAGSLIIQCRKK
ncbi:MAG TPA: class I SAM-dependent methyltransferase [Smithellaceae bacterium]|nr:class I SAM-dependent methyltransferase [Smithellaceae bacterium]